MRKWLPENGLMAARSCPTSPARQKSFRKRWPSKNP